MLTAVISIMSDFILWLIFFSSPQISVYILKSEEIFFLI